MAENMFTGLPVEDDTQHSGPKTSWGDEPATTATATATEDQIGWQKVPVAAAKSVLEIFTVKIGGITYKFEITDEGKVKCYTDDSQIFYGNCREDGFTGDNSYWMCFGDAFQSSGLPKGFYVAKNGNICYCPKAHFYKTLKAAAIGALKYYLECSQEPTQKQTQTQNKSAGVGESYQYEKSFPLPSQDNVPAKVWVKTDVQLQAEKQAEKAKAELTAVEKELEEFEAAEKAELEAQKALSAAAETYAKAQVIKDKLAALRAAKAANASTA